MRIIITGGTGLIGRRLAMSLIADGHEVIILSRSANKAGKLPAGARLEIWDSKTAQGWGELADGAGAIVNLAGESLGGTGFLPPRWTDEVKRKINESRSNSTQACIEAIRAAKKKPEVLIQSSAIGIYGVHGDEVLTEESAQGNDFQAQVCVAWEAASNEAESLGIRRVLLRTGLVLDPNEGVLSRFLLPYRLFAGGPFGSGKQWMSWVHIEDEVSAIRTLIQNKSLAGPFNVTAPNPVQNKEFGRILGKVLHRPSIMPVPSFALKLMLGEVATLALDGQRVVPERLQGAGFSFKFPQLEEALRDLL